MIRLALILLVVAAGPALAQVRPMQRPDDLPTIAVPAPDFSMATAATPSRAPAEDPDREDLAARMIEGLQTCWNVGELSPAAREVQIVVGFEMNPDATPIRETIELVEFSRGTQAAADEALGAAFRAIVRCGQDGLDLPADAFEQWQTVQVRFDASQEVFR